MDFGGSWWILCDEPRLELENWPFEATCAMPDQVRRLATGYSENDITVMPFAECRLVSAQSVSSISSDSALNLEHAIAIRDGIRLGVKESSELRTRTTSRYLVNYLPLHSTIHRLTSSVRRQTDIFAAQPTRAPIWNQYCNAGWRRNWSQDLKRQSIAWGKFVPCSRSGMSQENLMGRPVNMKAHEEMCRVCSKVVNIKEIIVLQSIACIVLPRTKILQELCDAVAIYLLYIAK